jgi:hypothetical protein
VGGAAAAVGLAQVSRQGRLVAQHHGRQHRAEAAAAGSDRAAFAVTFRYFGHNYVAISNFIPNNFINFIHDSILLSFLIWGMNIDFLLNLPHIKPESLIPAYFLI